ncbi:DUF6389 family protein [Agromyces sp. NPDC058064]|uniref:DUF6389 family protein n=1 Tax=Agromyces sp. NPDC058064 TaxID=3346322 RepID=UPI0036DE67CD
MGSADYRDALRAALDTRSAVAAERLAAMRAIATPATAGVVIELFTDQDAEGTFGVWARFDGADAFRLDRELGDERELFAVTWGEDGWEPEVPARPRGWSRDELEAAIAGVVAEWLDGLVPAEASELDWELARHDGASDTVPLGPSARD